MQIPHLRWEDSTHQVRRFHTSGEKIPHLRWEDSTPQVRRFHTPGEKIPHTRWKDSTPQVRRFHTPGEKIPHTRWEDSTHQVRRFHTSGEKIPHLRWEDSTHQVRRFHTPGEKIPHTRWEDSTPQVRRFHTSGEKIPHLRWEDCHPLQCIFTTMKTEFIFNSSLSPNIQFLQYTTENLMPSKIKTELWPTTVTWQIQQNNNKFSFSHLILGFPVESKLILWFPGWDLVYSEPLICRLQTQMSVSLHYCTYQTTDLICYISMISPRPVDHPFPKSFLFLIHCTLY